jgi:hypothetical protein
MHEPRSDFLLQPITFTDFVSLELNRGRVHGNKKKPKKKSRREVHLCRNAVEGKEMVYTF